MDNSLLANMIVSWKSEVAGGTLIIIVEAAVLSLIEGYLLYRFWRWPADRPVRIAVRANLLSAFFGILPMYYYIGVLSPFLPRLVGLSGDTVAEWWFVLVLVPYAVFYVGTTLIESVVIYDEARKHAGGRRFMRSLHSSALVNAATYALLLCLWLRMHSGYLL
jgi:hypothetical protein